MSTIVLHQLEISPFCDKVRRVLHLKGCDFEVRNVAMADLGQIKKQSPAGKLPVLELDGRVIADSSDICRALDTRFPTPPLFPDDPTAKALVDVIEDWADESLYFFEMTMRFVWPQDRARWTSAILKYDSALMQRLGRPLVAYLTQKQATQQGIARRSQTDILKELRRHIAAIDQLVLANGGYLVGGVLTLADIAVLAQIECIAGSGLGMAALKECPRVLGWMERIEDDTGGSAFR